MSVEYKVIQRNVLGGEEKGARKHYALAVITGEVDLSDITKEIEKTSTVSGADISAVLYALSESVPEHLANGRIVRLGELGSFRINISSRGEDSEKDVDENSIRKSKIVFTPGKKFTDMIKTLSFKKEK